MRSSRWLRLHSLPNGRRTATNDDERAEILRRHDIVAAATLGEGSSVVLFALSCRDGVTKPHSPFDAALLPQATLKHVATVIDSEENEHQLIDICAAEIHWKSGLNDILLLARADDVVGPLLFVNFATSCIYAPYDGGADLFFRSGVDVDAARIRHHAWLSVRPDGL
jgi:hypothetical protein